MTFQAVIILTCNFWLVFGSFLACEQLSNYGEQSEPGQNARARAEAPRTGELARRFFFLCHYATVLPGAGGFLRLFSRLKRRKDEMKKTSRRA